MGELLHHSYAGLAMAHAATRMGADSYGQLHFGIRKRLLEGLASGSMNIGSLVDDERVKLNSERVCCYCGAGGPLTLDHLLPRFRGGSDSGDNLVWACRSCNSSKGSRDLMEWMDERGEFPPLLLLRRYLKLAIAFCTEQGLMETPIESAPDDLPFSPAGIPRRYPSPDTLLLWHGEENDAFEAGARGR